MSALILPEKVFEAIRIHAEETYPHECCGLFVGRITQSGDREVVRAERARNMNTERAHDRFELHPEDYLRIDREASADKLEVIGCYHSHPDSPARPSAYDAERAFEYFSYLIVSVQSGKLVDQHSWQYNEATNSFTEEPIRAEP